MFFEKRRFSIEFNFQIKDFFLDEIPTNPCSSWGFVLPIIPYQVITGNYNKPDDKQKKLLLKKLKGEFEKDKETLISVLVPEGETVPDFDVELWYIYRIKNGELIKAFLPEEMIDAIIEGIRKSIFVETKTSITLDYDDTEKED